MRKNLRVNITKTDIERGLRNSTTHCPVARALNRKLKRYDVRVYCDQVVMGQSVLTRIIRLPRKTVRFIELFDEGKGVKPFSFIAKERCNG